jgi:branched-chain amino acid transport system ATP-binding protein
VAEALLAVETVSHRFGGLLAVNAASFSAPAGRITALIGPNGAGKTTLLNVLSGFVTPINGTIQLDGTALLGLSPRRRVALGLRRTFQQELVVDELTALENVRAIADHVSSDRASGRREVGLALDFVELGARRHALGRELNLFERRMVEIAKTLIGRPRLILMDEPGAGLNEAETGRLRHLLAQIPAAFDSQLVLIDHDADLIASVCIETLVLDFGKRLAMGPTRAVLDDPGVRSAYLGRE